MAIVFKNAVVLIDGAQLNCSFSDLTLEISAEILDGTTHCFGTRTKVGGLQNASLTGTGFVEFGTNSVEQVLFNLVGEEAVPITVYADGVVEGSVQGYAMQGVVTQFSLGGAVGELMTIDMTVEGSGIAAL